MRTLTTRELLLGLPKAEIHVHLQGSAPVSTVLELSRRHPDAGVPTEHDALAAFYEFRDFAHFIDVYVAVNGLVRTAADVETLAVGVARDLVSQQVRYAEVTVTPASHLGNGIAPDDLAEALDAARRTASGLGVEVAWVFDVPGEQGLPAGERTIDWVEAHAPVGSVGFGLGGPEVGVGRRQFADVFARARALGLHSVPHAGETTGPGTIRDALDHLGAERIGHGIRAVDDPALLVELAERGIPLEVCPTSNVCTRAVASLAEHPLPAMLEAGVVVTLNSDDPGMFSTTLTDEHVLAHEVLGLDLDAVVELARATVRSSYAPDPLRRRVLAEIDAYVADA